MAIEITAAGIDVEKVRPALSPKYTFAAVNTNVMMTPTIKPRTVSSFRVCSLRLMMSFSAWLGSFQIYGRPNFGGPPTRAEDMVDARQGSSRRTPISRDAPTRRNLINFYRRTFAVFDAMLFGAFLAQSRDAQFPNLIVDLAKCRFRKFMRRLHFFLERRHAGEGAIGLIARQCLQNLANV